MAKLDAKDWKLSIDGVEVTQFVDSSTRTISPHWLIENDACTEGFERFMEQCDWTVDDDYGQEFSILSLVGGKNTNGDLLWLASELKDMGNLPSSAVLSFIKDSVDLVAPSVREFFDPCDYEQILNGFTTRSFPHNRRAIFANALSTSLDCDYDRLNFMHLAATCVMADEFLFCDSEFEDAGISQEDFNRLITELFKHATS